VGVGDSGLRSGGWLLVCDPRGRPAAMSVRSKVALLQRFVQRTVICGTRIRVKFVALGWQAPVSCLCDRRVLESACIASVFAHAAGISVASRLAVPLTRLETRTKESNMCASHWAD
jgi:hypothetical protein